LLVSEINPESMIYSFYIDPHIGEALRPLKGDNQQTSSENIMVFPDLHVRRQDNLEVRVNENYSQASDWPDTSTLGASIDEKNDEMTKYFLNRVGP